MAILRGKMVWILLLTFEGITCINEGCIISHNQRYVSCRNMQLMEVPKRLPQKMRKLDLSRNLIRELHSDSFSRYRELKHLIIDDNELVHIHPNAFRGLERLTLLSLRRNKLNVSSADPNAVFNPLKSLEKLDISRNSDKKVSNKYDKYNIPTNDLTKLRELSIDLISKPEFGEKFKILRSLEKVTFDYCKADV